VVPLPVDVCGEAALCGAGHAEESGVERIDVGELTQWQEQAIERYLDLVHSHPELFRDRKRRPLVLDRQRLREYAATSGAVLGVAAATDYLWLLNDLVTSSRGDQEITHPYLRVIPPPGGPTASGVVMLATLKAPGQDEDLVVMVNQERHATGVDELELPRGFGTSGVDGADQVVEELRSETGYLVERVEHLGRLRPDSGAGGGLVDFFHGTVNGQVPPSPEIGEAIVQVLLVPYGKVWDLVRAGAIRDGFTVQALALYEHRAAGR